MHEFISSYPRKRILSFLLALICGLLCFSSCSADEKVLVDCSSVKYCRIGGDQFGFNVTVLVREKNAEIEFNGFDGENTDKMAVSFVEDTWDVIKGKKINGYYVRILGFVCDVLTDHVSISSLSLTVDGVKDVFPFDSPLQHSVAECSSDQYVHILNVPTLVGASSLDSNSTSATSFQFIYQAQQNVTITDFSFNAFLSFSDCSVYVDNALVGYGDNCFPFSVQAGSKIKFVTHLSSDSCRSTDSIYCDCLLDYLDDSGKNQTTRNAIVCQCAVNEKEMESVVDSIVSFSKVSGK